MFFENFEPPPRIVPLPIETPPKTATGYPATYWTPAPVPLYLFEVGYHHTTAAHVYYIFSRGLKYRIYGMSFLIYTRQNALKRTQDKTYRLEYYLFMFVL